MPHIHNIVDDDRHFKIDPTSRTISSEVERHYIVQYDHGSEQFTFEIPRIVEGHDMSLSNRIEVHYTNITRNRREQNDDVYFVKDDDRITDDDNLYFTWQIHANATQLAGSLKFSVTFLCHDENGELTYEWGTTLFDGIQVLAKNRNAESAIASHPDFYSELVRDVVDSIPEDAPIMVNGVLPDENGNIELDVSGDVASVNGVLPDKNGNITLDLSGDVASVNGVLPDEKGNITLDLSGDVASVNGVHPDENGNITLDISGDIKSVNGVLPDEKGNIEIEIPEEFVEGFETVKSGDYSHAEGIRTIASGEAAHAEGRATKATTNVSEVATVTTDTRAGFYAHAEGYGSVATGRASHAEGNGTKASGYDSHAEGYGTVASGRYAHAEGCNTKASSDVKEAAMTATTTSAGYSVHAEGYGTVATGRAAHAEGNGTKASGHDSHAEGMGTIAAGNQSHVQGKFNISDTSNAHVIGNGTEAKRSNAHTVDWNGNAWYSGDVYIGSTSGTNKDSGSKKLATEEYVDSKIGSSIPEVLTDEEFELLNAKLV